MLIYFLLFNKHKKLTDAKPLTRRKEGVFFNQSEMQWYSNFFGGASPASKADITNKKRY